jgi:diguanylate cyclase (GGDEF)-like protein
MPKPRPPHRLRFVHRLILLFLLAAVLPLLAVGALSFNEVSRHVRDRGFAELHESAKLAGLVVFGELDGLDHHLREAARSLRAGADPAEPGWAAALGDGFTAVSLLWNGDVVALQGPAEAAVTLSPDEATRVDLGQTVLRPVPDVGTRTGLLLIRALAPLEPDAGLLVARVAGDQLWGVQSMLPTADRLCVLQDDLPLFCTLPAPHRLAATLHGTGTDVGRFRFVSGPDRYLVSHWTLFLDARFGNPPWTVAVGKAEPRIMAPAHHLASVYGPAVLAVVLVAILVMLVRVRTRLEPLEALRQGIARIGAGDFASRVGIATGDELEELASGFNRMAARLQRQFDGLAVRAEIDRLILSSPDADAIVDTVLTRLPRLVPCNAAAVLTLGPEAAATARLAVHLPDSGRGPDELIRLDPDEAEALRSARDGRLLAAGDPQAGFLESLRQFGCRHFRVFPVMHQDRLAGAIALGHRHAPDPDPDDAREIKELADRVAVALSNAAWEEKLYRQAHYDALTDLPNRALMHDRLEQALVRARRARGQAALMFLDVDRFKAVNDSLSHAAGDRLLVHIAEAVSDCVREMDTVARFGGDEFVILLPDLPAGEHGDRVAIDIVSRILTRLTEPVDLEGYRVNVAASVGIAMFPRDAANRDEMLRNADAAMYHAKARARGGYEFFAPELNVAALERLALEQELRAAVEAGQFCVYYQPQVEADGGRIVGAEALVRWLHPERGMISPGVFVPIAEETGLINAIGAWVLQTAVAQARAWQEAGLGTLRMGVNVAPQQLARDDFPDTVRRVLETSGLDPGLLELEVTEGAIMSNTERNVAMLTTLRDLGVRLSVDDFGTGYSSLSYLQRFPLNTLKVDQSFTHNMMENADSAAIAAAVVALGHSLGLSVIAEGVETREQRARLLALGCEELQGYLFGRPLPAEEFARVLVEGHGIPA